MTVARDKTAHFERTDSWHGKVELHSNHPPEAGRFHMYIGQ